MAEETGQEKTEEPTPRRLEKAREEGQVARSTELGSVATLVCGMLLLLLTGPFMLDRLEQSFLLMTEIGRFDPALEPPLARLLAAGLGLGMQAALPVLGALLLVSLGAGSALGGLNWSTKPLTPKLDKLDPVKGLGRMFSANSLVELFKASLKFLLVAAVTGVVLYAMAGPLVRLARAETRAAVADLLLLAFGAAAAVAAALVLVVLIDVPWQLHQHSKKLRMTRQDVKDEFKETEGKPEVKGRIRELQREIANRRMLDDVGTADVVVTNPDHYSVALRYEAGRDAAPVVVAKGLDRMALRIREVARAEGVECLALPPLARSLHRHTPVGAPVPRALFVAVAQVLAYVHQLREYRRGRGRMPGRPRNVPIPDAYQVAQR